MSDLVKEFQLPDEHDLRETGVLRLVLQDPVKTKTYIQKLQAYEQLKKGCPEVSVASAKKKELRENIRLLQEGVSLVLDTIKVKFGIDFSKDEYKVVAKKERKSAQEKTFENKQNAYLKERAAFLREE